MGGSVVTGVLPPSFSLIYMNFISEKRLRLAETHRELLRAALPGAGHPTRGPQWGEVDAQGCFRGALCCSEPRPALQI